MAVQVAKEHYSFGNYMSKGRWVSIWHQLDEVLRLRPRAVLEIGVGTGLFNTAARQLGITVESIDIDPELRPDYVGSVLALPFLDQSYDVVVCFQVLEHLPFDRFGAAMSEIARVSSRHVVLSLPDAESVWRYAFHIPLLGERNVFFRRPRLTAPRHEFDGQHFWEINKAGYPLGRVLAVFDEQSLKLQKTFRVAEYLNHRFFVLNR